MREKGMVLRCVGCQRTYDPLCFDQFTPRRYVRRVKKPVQTCGRNVKPRHLRSVEIAAN